MAKTQSGGIQFDTVTADKAQQELTELRGGRGGRTSQFASLFEAVKELKDGQVIRLTLTKSQSLNLGQQLKKRFGTDIKMSTAASKEDPNSRMIYIMNRA